MYYHSCIWKRRIFAIWRIWCCSFAWAITFFNIPIKDTHGHTISVGPCLKRSKKGGGGVGTLRVAIPLTGVMVTCDCFCICFRGVESEDFFDGYESAVYVATAKQLTSLLSFTLLLLLPKYNDQPNKNDNNKRTNKKLLQKIIKKTKKKNKKKTKEKQKKNT